MSRYHPTTISNLLEHEMLRKVQREEQGLYAATDVVRLLADTQTPEEYWEDLKQREPQLATIGEQVSVIGRSGEEEVLEMLDLPGVLRLIQAIPSQRAERTKRWMAEAGRQRIEEAENPELAMLRAARLYEMRGRTRQWTDKRLRGVSARHELTREWRRRGLTESDQYRQLTNDLMRAAFGMDVNEYRRFKNLIRPTDNLRDHMNDLELVLTMLAETTAAQLHRDHQSQAFEAMDQDVKAAGRIVAQTREQIEQASGRAVVQGDGATVAASPSASRPPAPAVGAQTRRPSRPGQDAADTSHAPEPQSRPVQTAAPKGG